MINRVLLRKKIIQILYSFYKGDGRSLKSAEDELFFSIGKTYQLYFHLLLLSVEITRYAAERIEARRNKLRPNPEDLNPNTRFIDNAFIHQLKHNKFFNDYIKANKLSWVNYPDVVKEIYEEIIITDFYAEYMSIQKSDYEDDKNIWKKIYKKIILQNEELDCSLEEQSIYWVDDVELVISFILKTIKRFQISNGNLQELLPMFKDEEDSDFARNLFRFAITNGSQYRGMIEANTKNWEIDRVAFMDTLLMEVALAELINFPTIPVNVTLNEYIEIAKNYSTEKSGTFINGVLDNIVNQLKKEKKLIKVVMFDDGQK
jgi:N utilization substance protein B